MSVELKGKSIILISTSYFGYYQHISSELVKKGANVTTFVDNPLDFIKLKVLNLSIFRKIIGKYIIQVYNSYIIRKVKSKKVDYILVVRGDNLSVNFLQKLKNISDAKLIMYQWDSIKNFDYLNFVSYFDKVCSFDPVDCKNYDFEYIQLFALKSFDGLYKNRSYPIKYDFLLMGFNHSIRYRVAQKISDYCIENNKKCKILLYNPPILFIIAELKKHGISKFLKKVVHFNKHYSFITFRSVSTNQWQNLLQSSSHVIDLPHPEQNGLTMRTFETLASGNYLYTTNKQLLNEPFYTKEAMGFFNEDNIQLPEHSEFVDMNKYFLDSWVDRIFS